MPLPYSPLPKEQEALRGKKVRDLTDAQLLLWLKACDTMEGWVTNPKARRGWKDSRTEAVAEIERRKAKAGRLTARPKASPAE